MMAHRVQDARAEQPVIGRLGQRQRLDEIPLRQRVMRHAVITHPGRKQSCLGDRGEQSTADGLGISAAQQPVTIATEVLNQGLARMPATEPVIKLLEQLHGRLETLDIPHAHPHAA
jgi:hypothetical protein